MDDEAHQEQLRRRMRAGRVIAGMEKVDDLAAKINQKGLKRDTLYLMEGGKRRIQPHEVPAIAKGLGVDPEFFELDFSNLSGKVDTGRVDTLESDIADLKRTVDVIQKTLRVRRRTETTHPTDSQAPSGRKAPPRSTRKAPPPAADG